jgi:hypothetical protein
MRSHPQLPLTTPEEDPEVIIRKGNPSQGESSATEPSISPPPSIKTPFSYSQLHSQPFLGVSHFLNFGSVPAELSPLVLGLEGEILVTPLSSEAVPQCRPRTTKDFPTPAQTGAPADLSLLDFSLNPLLFPTLLQDSFPTAPS